MVSVLKQNGSFLYKRLLLLCLGPEKLLFPCTFAIQKQLRKSGIEPQDFHDLSREKVEKVY